MTDYKNEALDLHGKFKGKIEIKIKDNVDSKEKLSTYYTPGVAAISEAIAANPEDLKKYTWASNNLAIISNGTSVLGLGDIGPKASLPVMEGKAMLFKQFAGIDAVPIVINSKNPDDFVRTVKDLAPGFSAINLEDIAAPECFDIEKKLIEELDIPIMHDDQHGTAIIVLAGLINAMKVVGKELNFSKIVLVGSGAAGTAIAKLIHEFAINAELILVDSKGILSSTRSDMNESKNVLLRISNPKNISGSLEDALTSADVFIGVSRGNLLNADLIRKMNPRAIIFAMANPTPEISPDEAKRGGAEVIATGRSDYPNQINNALVFPGLFKGAIDSNTKKITTEHKINAAKAIANLIENPTKDEIIPSIFDDRLVPALVSVFHSNVL